MTWMQLWSNQVYVSYRLPLVLEHVISNLMNFETAVIRWKLYIYTKVMKIVYSFYVTTYQFSQISSTLCSTCTTVLLAKIIYAY